MSNNPVRVLVIGCGGIGSYFGEGMVKMLNFEAPFSALTLLDGDTFEPKNMARQNFTNMGNKAVSLQEEWQPKYPQVFILAEAAWIVDQATADAFEPEEDEEQDNSIRRVTAESQMEENMYVFCTVDNFAARKLVFEAAEKFDNIDVFTGGNGSVEDGNPLFGTLYHYQRRDGQDVTMQPGVMHPEFVEIQDKNPGQLSCQERAELAGATQVISVNMAVASYLLGKASHVMFGDEEQKQAAIERCDVYFDLAECLAMPYDRRLTPELVTTSTTK